MRQLVHIIDWIAAAFIAIALATYLPGVIKLFNVIDNIWAYSVLVMASVTWAIARVLFKRLASGG